MEAYLHNGNRNTIFPIVTKKDWNGKTMEENEDVKSMLGI